MRTVQFIAVIGILLVASPAYAVPSLLPLLPLLVTLIVKGVLLFSSVFFLLLSNSKKHSKLYLGIGTVLLIIFALAMVFVRHV